MNWDYIAGFFDGEGNITIYDFARKRIYRDNIKKGQRQNPDKIYESKEGRISLSMAQKLHFRILMTQKKNRVLQLIQDFLNYEGIKTSLKTHRLKNSIYQGVIARDDIQILTIIGGHKSHLLFLEKIEPYLIVKKEKAILAIEYIKNKIWYKHTNHERGFKQWRGLRSTL